MPAGRPPKPTEQKRRLGNPGQRKLPDTASVTPLQPAQKAPPDHLGSLGRGLWERVVVHAAPWLGQADRETLQVLCEGMDRRAELLDAVRQSGWVLYTDKGYAYANPAAGQLSALEAQITKWLSALALTPVDRARLGVAEVREDDFDRFRARQTARRSGGGVGS